MLAKPLSILAAAILFAVSTGTTAVAQPVEIRLYDRVYSAPQEEYSKWLVDRFNEDHEGEIKVIWGGVPSQAFKSAVGSVLRTPGSADVYFSWEGGWAKYMIDSGFAEPLDRYYEQYGWEEILSPAGVKLATIAGHKYFVPTMMSASVVWYRPDIFEEHGIAVPTNWDEFLEAGRKLKEAGIAPTMLANQDAWPAQFLWTAIFVNRNGVEAYDDLIARRIPWTDPRVVEAFQDMKDLMDAGFFEDGANGLDVTPAVVPFARGEVATWYQGTFMTSRFTNESGEPNFPLGYFPFPQIGDREPSISVFAENTMMINANSAHKDAAAAFLNWIISEEAQARQTEQRELYPANRNVEVVGVWPLFAEIGQMIADYEESTFMHVDHAAGPALSDVYLQSLQGVLVGIMSPEEAAAHSEEAAIGEQGPVVQ